MEPSTDWNTCPVRLETHSGLRTDHAVRQMLSSLRARQPGQSIGLADCRVAVQDLGGAAPSPLSIFPRSGL